MSLQLDVSTLVYLLISLVAAFYALAKLLMWQFNKTLAVQFEKVAGRMDGQDKEFDDIKRRLDKQEDSDKELERGMSMLRAELPRDYVRREDFTRVIASFEVKVDNLRLTIERLFFEGKGGQ